MDPRNDTNKWDVVAFAPLREERRQQPLASAVHTALTMYFRDVGSHHCGELYDLVIAEVERPLLETTLRHAGGNLSKAAEILGINRSTLRKKLTQYSLI